MVNIKNVFKKEKGTTLVEVLLSVALLAIIVTPLLGTVLASVQNNTASKDKTEAIALAEEVMGEIKAQKVITTTIPTPSGSAIQYPITDSGVLVPYYEITQEGRGSITPSAIETYNYVASAADNPDFELVIDQGTANDGKVDSVILKDGNSNILVDTLPQNLSVADNILKLNVVKSGSNYSYFFDEKLETATVSNSGLFNPKDPNEIKLKVTYTANTVPSAADQLKIFTYIDSGVLDLFKVYVINNEEANSGVDFINKGNENFEVIYMNTQAFDFTTPLNKLFKVTVTIKKNLNVIYVTSSYVKK
ncbi:MAG TPA: hypothetical protein VIK78_01415 [Ruminiclostridium sp.]